jgi:ketosteroid isomerase-like protein
MQGTQWEERAAIQAVLVDYALGVDRRDWALVASCFAPDARADYGYVARGPASQIIATLQQIMPQFETTLHALSNFSIELQGDHAGAITYCLAHHRMKAIAETPRQLLVVGVRYEDELTRLDGRWRITKRIVHMDWQSQYPVTVPGERA